MSPPESIVDCRRIPEQPGVIISLRTAISAHFALSSISSPSAFHLEELNELKDALAGDPKEIPESTTISKKPITLKVTKSLRAAKSARHAFSQIPDIEGVNVRETMASLDNAVELLHKTSQEIEGL